MSKKTRRQAQVSAPVESEPTPATPDTTVEPTPASEPVADTPVPDPAPAEPVATPAKTSARLGLGLCGLPALRRMDFQDALLEANREMRLTDNQLAICMMVEHPGMCHIPLGYVRGIRRLYNAGRHTKHQVKPATPVPAFNENREPIGVADTTEPVADEPAAAEAVG